MSESPSSRRRTIAAILRREAREFVTIRRSNRPWQFPFAVAVAVGLPVSLGAWLDAMTIASLGAIGAMTIVYMPRTALGHRASTLMAVAFAMTACYALGQVSQLVPPIRVPVVGAVAVVTTLACRYYRVVPPGPLFLVMATAIGAYAPGQIDDMPFRLGVFALGTIGAVAVGFVYSVHMLRRRAPLPVSPPPQDMVAAAIDSLIIGVFVGLSLAIAQGLSIEKPYWAPVSCLAVIQGVSLRAVWIRQAERTVGTLLGLGLTWGVILVATDPWAIALALVVLTFCIETAIVRQYAFAAMFITPLTILLAETSSLGSVATSTLLAARFADTVVGALAGLLGGIFLHSSALRRIPRRRLQSASDEG